VRLRAFMDREGMGQSELARKAGVSQSTVSRVLAGALHRGGKGRKRLLEYAEISTNITAPRDQVIAAFDALWDGSEAQAAAVASIMRALAELVPKAKGRREQ
jgi:transcriptional regulator with XRE-family HTH domain